MGIENYDDAELLEEITHRGIDTIKTFSDTELNDELTRRRHEAEKRYEEMMKQGLV